MSTTLNLAGAVQLGFGATVGAAVAVAVHHASPSRFTLATINAVVCAAMGVVTMTALRWPQIPVLAAVGVLGAAAPITLAVAQPAEITTVPEALRYLRRVAATVTLHLVYGIGFAALGFSAALAAVLVIVGST